MRHHVILLALCTMSLNATAQPLRLNTYRVLDAAQAKGWMASRGYQMLSGFDTVWRTPLRVYAWYMKGNKWGLLDINGKEITPPLYDEIEGLNQSYTSVMLSFHDHYPVRIGNRRGWIRNDGKAMSSVMYDGVRFGDYDVVKHHRGYAIDKSLRIEEGEAERMVTPLNKPYTPKAEMEETRSYSSGDSPKWPDKTSHGTIYIRTGFPAVVVESRTASGRRYGVVDLQTDQVLYPLECSNLGYDSWNRRFIGKRGDSLVFLDLKGKSLPTDGATAIKPFNGLYLFYRGNKIALRNRELKAVTGYEFDDSGSGNGECLLLYAEKKCGVYAVPSGAIILPARFDGIDMVENKSAGKIQYFYAKQGKYWGIYDRAGKQLLAPQFRSIESVSELTSSGGGGGDVVPEMGSYFWESNPYFLAVDSVGKRWLLTRSFQRIALPAMDDIRPLRESEWMSMGKRDTSLGRRAPLRWGVYNWKKQAWVHQPQYIEEPKLEAVGHLLKLSEGFGMYGLWDLRQARWLIPMQKQASFSVDRIHQGLYMIFSQKGRWWLDSYGNRENVVRE